MLLRTLLLTRFLSISGLSIGLIVIPLFVYHLTQSTALVGVVMVLQWLPRLALPILGIPFIVRSKPLWLFRTAEKSRICALLVLFGLATPLNNFVPHELLAVLVGMAAAVSLTAWGVIVIVMDESMHTPNCHIEGARIQAWLRGTEFISTAMLSPLVGVTVLAHDNYAIAFLLPIPLLLISHQLAKRFCNWSWPKRIGAEKVKLTTRRGRMIYMVETIHGFKLVWANKEMRSLQILVLSLAIPINILAVTYPAFLAGHSSGSIGLFNLNSQSALSQIKLFESLTGLAVATLMVQSILVARNAMFYSSIIYLSGFIICFFVPTQVEYKLVAIMTWLAGYFAASMWLRGHRRLSMNTPDRAHMTGAMMAADTMVPLLAGVMLSFGLESIATYACLVIFLLLLRPVTTSAERFQVSEELTGEGAS